MSFNGQVTQGKFSPIFGWLGGGKLFGVPASVLVAGFIFVVVIVLLNYTRWGRAFYAVGGNPIAATSMWVAGTCCRQFRRLGYAVLGANKPNAFGTLIGVIFVATLINGLTMFNLPYYAQSFVQGVLLVIALLISYMLGPRRR